VVEVAEDVVCEAVLAQGVPNVFRRVELRAVWRQEHQSHVVRHAQFARNVPTSLVHDHEDEFGGVALGDFCQEHRHRLSVDPGQHQAVHHAVVRADGAEGVDVLAFKPRTHDGARAARCPASLRRTQQSEAAFVLEHESHLAALLSLASDLLAYRSTKFF
jgi:hypothetical protein